jgi:hypothetical protein
MIAGQSARGINDQILPYAPFVTTFIHYCHFLPKRALFTLLTPKTNPMNPTTVNISPDIKPAQATHRKPGAPGRKGMVSSK